MQITSSNQSLSLTIEIVALFSVHELSQREMSRIAGVSHGVILSIFRCVLETIGLIRGIHGHRLTMITSKEGCAFLHFMKGNRYLSASKVRVEPIRLIGRCVFVLFVQRRLVATRYHLEHTDKFPRLTRDHLHRHCMLVRRHHNWNYQYWGGGN